MVFTNKTKILSTLMAVTVALQAVAIPVQIFAHERNGYTLIGTVAELNAIHQNLNGYFRLNGDGTSNEGDSQADDPTFVLHTEIPHGETSHPNRSNIRIAYTATPSTGAYITSVSYSVNGREPMVIYSSEDLPIFRDLGEGTVHFWPGENNIVFTVTDSLGGQVSYNVSNVPYNTGSFSLPSTGRVITFPEGTEAMIINNRILLTATANASFEEVEEAVSTKNGRITGYLGSHSINSLYEIQVPENTGEGLTLLAESFLKEFPHLFKKGSVAPVLSIGSHVPRFASIEPAADDPRQIGETSPHRFRLNEGDNWWDEFEWGVSRIRLILLGTFLVIISLRYRRGS